ncbi:MAG: hypothetical protein ACXACI_04575 [Candidatus Hodarchaeales archaeon]|jgi:hypothetical protein
MTTVTMDKALAEELVDLKLSFLQNEIQRILSKWNYQSADDFLEHARNGTLEEAEDDAITLKHLLDQLDELRGIKSRWSS